MACNLYAGDGLQPTSNGLFVMPSNLLAMASNLLAMASNLIAMAYNKYFFTLHLLPECIFQLTYFFSHCRSRLDQLCLKTDRLLIP